MSQYYGKTAYNAFAQAFAARHGLTVNVNAHTVGSPCVDANGSIVLPNLETYQTRQEFEHTCATIIHEIAHVLYGSHAEFATHAAKGRLFQDCLNAVFDVADETGIGELERKDNNLRPQYLLENANADTWNSRYRELIDPNHPLPHWQILATGIMRARVPQRARHRSAMGWGLKRRYPNMDLATVFRSLQGARKGPRVKDKHGACLTKAKRLYDILLPLAPPDNTPEQPQAWKVAFGKGQVSLPQGSTEVDATEAAAFGADPVARPMGSHAQGCGSSLPAPMYNEWHPCSTEARAMFLPITRRIADRLATDGDSINRDDGYFVGTGVADASRLFTDGACMGRWAQDPHADGLNIAVVLDGSGSMYCNGAEECAGLADAFVTAMRQCAEVRTWIFDDAVYEVDNFRQWFSRGGTRTYLAIDEATKWLSTREGRRVIVCITDGLSNADDTQSAVDRARAAAIDIVGIALMERADPIRRTMRGAQIIAAPDVNRMAIALDTIGRSF